MQIYPTVKQNQFSYQKIPYCPMWLCCSWTKSTTIWSFPKSENGLSITATLGGGRWNLFLLAPCWAIKSS